MIIYFDGSTKYIVYIFINNLLIGINRQTFNIHAIVN